MGVSARPLLGLGYMVSRNCIEESYDFPDGTNFYDLQDEYYDNIRKINAYDRNSDVFIGVILDALDLSVIIDDPSWKAKYEDEARKMFKLIFKDSDSNIPDPEFFVNVCWD